jgi:thioredoxin 1
MRDVLVLITIICLLNSVPQTEGGYLPATAKAAFSRHDRVTARKVSKLGATGLLTLLDETNYQRIMLQEGKTVLIDACAKWCGPCKLMEPILEKCSAEHVNDAIEFVKWDVEEKKLSNLKVELLLQGAQLKALPCFLLVCKGKVVAQRTGVMTKDEMNVFLKKAKSENAGAKKSIWNDRAISKVPKKAGLVSLLGYTGSDDYMLKSP